MINLYTGREYYSLPAKKAADLQSLDELNLSKSAERCLKKYYQTLPEIIWQGRRTAISSTATEVTSAKLQSICWSLPPHLIRKDICATILRPTPSLSTSYI